MAMAIKGEGFRIGDFYQKGQSKPIFSMVSDSLMSVNIRIWHVTL